MPALVSVLFLIDSRNWPPAHTIFCLWLEMVLKVVAWAISRSNSVFLVSPMYTRGTHVIRLVFLLLICFYYREGVSQPRTQKKRGKTIPSTHTLKGPPVQGDVQKFDMNQVAITKSKHSRV